MSNKISLRDYFASAALQGLLSDSSLDWDVDRFCTSAYKYADTMLKQRNKREEQPDKKETPT